MNQKRRNGSRVIAALLLFSITQIGLATRATAIPQQFIARLTTRNNQPITVNGLSAATGASIVTGATIETGADQSATVNLGSLGTLDIAPNTKLVLTYDDQGNLKALIIYGCAILTAKKKTSGEIATEQGSAGKTDPAAGGVLDVCFPQGATAPQVGQGAAAAAGAGAGASTATAAAGGGGLFGLGRAATIAIFAGIGAVALTPLAFQDNPSGSQP
ncbi:MAG TPA: hypothetical protein VFT44_08630 [Pyrinomonadaceae bacterium]|nr:hypothetical protein [Pyrinomonadaceae bacterium]